MTSTSLTAEEFADGYRLAKIAPKHVAELRAGRVGPVMVWIDPATPRTADLVVLSMEDVASRSDVTESEIDDIGFAVLCRLTDFVLVRQVRPGLGGVGQPAYVCRGDRYDEGLGDPWLRAALRGKVPDITVVNAGDANTERAVARRLVLWYVNRIWTEGNDEVDYGIIPLAAARRGLEG